jgi:hypothetical protein
LKRRPHFKIYKSRERTKIRPWDPRRPETKNGCAGEAQQKLTRLVLGTIIYIHAKFHKDWFRHSRVGKGDIQTHRPTDSMVIA